MGIFRSFWQAGFECSCQINSAGHRLDMIAAVQHDRLAAEDYAMLRSVGIRTARDGLRWHLIERGGAYDFSSWQPMLEAARRQGVQVIWDICHYGWPDDLDLFSPAFVDRFAKFCTAVTRFHNEHTDEPPFFAPVNEISFFAWAASRDLIFPYAWGRDGEVKRQIVRAAVAGSEAILAADKRARLMFPEPMIHNVPPRRRPWLRDQARIQDESQFEAWDMISGRACPELGGSPRLLDIVGVNYYAANQWEVPGGRKLRWAFKPLDERWVPLEWLLERVYRRYNRPLLIAETSHYGAGRAAWIREVAGGVYNACAAGIPVEGICLYPILDRFDWEDKTHWHNSGLFDFAPSSNGHYIRVLNPEYAEALRESQGRLAQIHCV